MNLFTKHWNARKAMNVRRYHQHSVGEVDTVGKHSCGVAALVLLLHPDCSRDLLHAAIVHDFSEFTTGDIPATVKRMLSVEFREEYKHLEREVSEQIGWVAPTLSENEAQLLKVCDYLDGLSYCIEERTRGNLNLRTVGDTYLKYIPFYIETLEPWCARAKELFSTLHAQWNTLNER